MPIDLTKLTPAPWMVRRGNKLAHVRGPHGEYVMEQGAGPRTETDAEFIALARNAFAGDPEALAWWEANRTPAANPAPEE